MSRDQHIVECPPGEYTQLTNGDTATASFQVKEGELEIVASDSTKPGPSVEGWDYGEGEGELDAPLAKFRAAGATRLWGKPTGETGARVLVDHA